MSYTPYHSIVMQKYKSANSSKSRMFYLASGCEERVREEFESRVTRWNPRKDVRVHGHARSDVGTCGNGRWRASCTRLAGVCVAVLRYCSPESTVFARNEEINLK
ncbi:hypothetical protein CRG98_006371 [Punica granatum]|uniref:Uncharacterized protein n=1 Tax=Punica granatum TaxID=22663 RepID=A0A2I0KZD9_PUNGR|nr:hypothetical protein CRG98_006371 [Punica granatum]